MRTPPIRPQPPMHSLWSLALALALLSMAGCDKQADDEEVPKAKSDSVVRVDVVHYNPAAKAYSKGPCEALFTMGGRICGQRGKAAVLSDADRELLLKVIKDRQSYRAPATKSCWAPRHAFILMDKANEQLGYFDLSIPCAKLRSGDRKGALATEKRELFQDLTPEARKQLAGIIKRAGLPVDDYLALEVPRGEELPVPIAPIVVTVPDAPTGGKAH
jgi:hypothetical protein